ncbi:MAG: YggT family protein [Acidimicrobiales bacterium]
MTILTEVVCAALRIYVVLILARVILSYFPLTPGSVFLSIDGLLRKVTEPVLSPVRRVLPPVGVGGMGLDLAPLVVILVVYLVLLPIVCG